MKTFKLTKFELTREEIATVQQALEHLRKINNGVLQLCRNPADRKWYRKRRTEINRLRNLIVVRRPLRKKPEPPKRIRMLKTVKPDLPPFLSGADRRLVCTKDETYAVKVNPQGAVTVITQYGELGIKPDEFEWVEGFAP